MAQHAQAGKIIYPAHVPGLKQARVHTTEDAIESPPVVDGKTLYIGSKDQTLSTLDARTSITTRLYQRSPCN
jgi:hypothetical protein